MRIEHKLPLSKIDPRLFRAQGIPASFPSPLSRACSKSHSAAQNRLTLFVAIFTNISISTEAAYITLLSMSKEAKCRLMCQQFHSCDAGSVSVSVLGRPVKAL